MVVYEAAPEAETVVVYESGADELEAEVEAGVEPEIEPEPEVEVMAVAEVEPEPEPEPPAPKFGPTLKRLLWGVGNQR